MEIALVARADARTWLNQVLGEMRRAHAAQTRHHRLISTRTLSLDLPQTVVKDIKKSQVSFQHLVVLREKISRALARQLIVEFVETVKADSTLRSSALRIAFDFYGSGLLVWVETPSTEPEHKSRFDAIRDHLNKRYTEMGMTISLAYFTEQDEMPFPPEYVAEANVIYVDPNTFKRTKRPGPAVPVA
jgi:hypothetical protein